MKFTVTTFNVENMFNRCKSLDIPGDPAKPSKFKDVEVVEVEDVLGPVKPNIYQTTNIQRVSTAAAIKAAQPDIMAFEEIEDLYTLRIFNHKYLGNYFDRMISILGNDLRGINVGFAIKAGCNAQITGIRTHTDEGAKPGQGVTRWVNGTGYITENAVFSRDCLEVDVEANGKPLTFLVNHFKSQLNSGSETDHGKAKRILQSTHVTQYVDALCAQGRLPIVLGDFNIAPGLDGSLEALLANANLRDPFPSDTWTHFWSDQKEVSRLDYILPHKELTVVATNIVRDGLSKKCTKYTGSRFPGVEGEGTEASDHCPTSVVLDI